MAGPLEARFGLDATRPASTEDQEVWAAPPLFSTRPRLSTLKLVYWLCDRPAAFGVAMFTSGVPLAVIAAWVAVLTGATGRPTAGADAARAGTESALPPSRVRARA